MAIKQEKVAVITQNNNNMVNMVVDSGTCDHYVDRILIHGLKEKVVSYTELDFPRVITTAGKHKLLGTAAEMLHIKATDSTRATTVLAKLPVAVVPGIGRLILKGSGSEDGTHESNN